MAASNNSNKITPKQQSIPKKNAPNIRSFRERRRKKQKQIQRDVIAIPWLKTKSLVK